jgi:2OG-Fe(II) oxygenase superfamily
MIDKLVKKMAENGADISPLSNHCNEVFIIKNFFSNAELLEIREELNLIDWNSCKWNTADNVEVVLKHSDRFRAYLEDTGYLCKDLHNVISRRTGQGMHPHSDVINNEAILRAIEVDENFEGEKFKNGRAILSFVVYFNDDYEGGEICYPEYGIEYKPNAGDIVLHNPPIVHAVKKVKSGLRFTHQNVIDGFCYVDAVKARQIVELDEDIKYKYDITSPVILHERLSKFKSTYKDEGLYS